MGILTAFAPFFVYVVAERIWGIQTGLVTAALVSAALLIRDWLSPRKKVKVLELGTAILFGSLAAYAMTQQVAWSVAAVRLRVDAGLLVIVLISIAICQPFTLQYARESVDAALWNTSGFVRTNYIITSVWALAFALMVAADLALVYATQLPPMVGIGVTVLAIWGAVHFTSWYPDRARLQAS